MDIHNFISVAYNPWNAEFKPLQKFKVLTTTQKVITVGLGVLTTLPFIITGPAVALLAIELFYRSKQRMIVDLKAKKNEEESSTTTNIVFEKTRSNNPHTTDEKQYRIEVEEGWTIDFSKTNDYPMNYTVDSFLATSSKSTVPKKLETYLETQGCVPGHAPDDGDCFYDSIGQQLSKFLGKTVTAKELREVLAKELTLCPSVALIDSFMDDINDQNIPSEDKERLEIWLKCKKHDETEISSVGKIVASYLIEDAADYREKHKKLLSSRKDLIKEYNASLEEVNKQRTEIRNHIDTAPEDKDILVKKITSYEQATDKASGLRDQITQGLHQPLWGGGDAEMQVLAKHYQITISTCSNDNLPDLGFVSLGESDKICRIANYKGHFIPVWKKN